MGHLKSATYEQKRRPSTVNRDLLQDSFNRLKENAINEKRTSLMLIREAK